jgi:Uma2 family endonuclease
MEAAPPEFKIKPAEKMSYEEFLDWCDEDTLAEWVDGEIIMYSPASNRHQDLSDFLISVLRIYTEMNRLGIIRSSPFQMKLPGDLPGREPDLIFVSASNIHRLRDTYLDGPADLAVEIISKESISRDREKKFLEYEIAGVPEYWLIDPLHQETEFYQIGTDNQYHQFLPDAEDIYHSQIVTGFWLKVSWLWQEPLPRVLDVLRELGIL